MNAAEHYDAEAIRGDEFRDTKAFSVAKKKILDALVDSIAHFEYGGIGNPQVQIAMDLEMVDYAKKLLNSSFQQANQAEDLERLHRLHGLVLELSIDPLYNYEEPGDVLSYAEVVAEISLRNRLMEHLGALRNGVRSGPMDRALLARNVADDIADRVPATRRNSFLKLKVQVATNILENTFVNALDLQEKLVSGMRNGLFQANSVEKLTEHAVLVTLNLANGDTHTARQQALRMGAISTTNPREERFLNTHFINSTFSLAEKTLNLDILEQGLERFRTCSDYLSPTAQAIHLRLAVAVTFYNSAFKQSLRLLKQLEGLNSKEWDAFKWFVRLIELTIALDTGDMDRFDYALSRAKRAVVEEDGPYPMAVLRFLDKAGRHFSGQLSELDCRTCLAELDAIAEDPNADKQMSFFDFRVWLNSKLAQTSMLEIVNNDESKQWKLVSGIIN